VKNKHLRRLRDIRIELERQKCLPTGDSEPVRRWGGRLPGFGFGAAATYGLQCKKIETQVILAGGADRPRGFTPLSMDAWLGDGAPAGADGANTFELYGVIEHLGATPFSGHYVATCWHHASQAWMRFNDSHVSRLPPSSVASDSGGVLTRGSYVVLLERSS